MRLANGDVLMHAGQPYDPQKAHEYYERTKKLKGRKKGKGPDPTGGSPLAAAAATKRARQKQELTARVANLEGKLRDLEALIAKKVREAKEDARKSQKEAAKPDTAAEKAKKARDSKKYRREHKQELKNKAKQAAGKSGGSSKSTSSSSAPAEKSVDDLKALATKVKGQLAVAKTRLRAL